MITERQVDYMHSTFERIEFIVCLKMTVNNVPVISILAQGPREPHGLY